MESERRYGVVAQTQITGRRRVLSHECEDYLWHGMVRKTSYELYIIVNGPQEEGTNYCAGCKRRVGWLPGYRYGLVITYCIPPA